MERVKQLQARGNGCYRDGRYVEARGCYSLALRLLETLPLSDSSSSCERAETASQLYANRAQTAIQERDFGAALADARLALKRNPRNEKAAMRQLIALENLERFEAALEHVDRVLDGKPVDRDQDWRWGRENAPALFQYCVSVRRRLRKMLAKDREAAVKELNQLGKLVHDNQQLRINFGSLVPSQVPLGNFFDVSVNIGNEFGLFRRDMVKDGERVALKCELYNPQSGGCISASSLVYLEVRLDSDNSGDSGSHDGQKRSTTAENAVPIVLDARGKAKFRIAVVRSDTAVVDSTQAQSPGPSRLAIKVSAHDTSAQKWNLFPVVSLPIMLAEAHTGLLPGDSGALGVHCCRPVRMHGLSQDILLAESPGSLGIGGKLWDSCLILTRYLARHRELLVGKTAVELGSGLGLVGIYCSLLGARVTLTDMAEVVPLIQYNIALNYPSFTSHPSHRPKAVAHMWGSTDDQELLSSSPDVVVLSDVVYDPEGYAPLVASLEALAKTPDTLVLMAHRSRNPKEHQFFEMLGQSFSFALVDWQRDLNAAVAEEAPSGQTEVAREQVDPALQDVKIFRIARRSE